MNPCLFTSVWDLEAVEGEQGVWDGGARRGAGDGCGEGRRGWPWDQGGQHWWAHYIYPPCAEVTSG